MFTMRSRFCSPNLLFAFGVLCLSALATRPSTAAELKILEPADRTVLKGVVTFRIQPFHSSSEQYFSDPDVIVQDEVGNEVQRVIAVLDRKAGVCVAPLDTRKLRDGICHVSVRYRTLFQGRTARMTEEDLTYGIRNGAAKPVRFTVTVPAKPVGNDDYGDVTVTVFDAKGKPMPGARVTFKVDKGDVDTDAEITDSDGEATCSVDTDTAGSITLTVIVEGLPPMTKTLTFVD